jgi:tagaturonate reductase
MQPGLFSDHSHSITMILSRYSLKNIQATDLQVPDETIFELPEKVLQFGTGVLLRGLPDYFIDKANRQGIFNGRVVIVKSTTHGDTADFDKQDSLFTQCIRGIENGQGISENIVNASISRVLSAHGQWQDILQCAHSKDMQVIISNTTEVGIQLVKEDIRKHPPESFPGKLLAFLYERYKAFNGSEHSGMVIIPTELIVDNGKKLEAIVLELAHLNNLEDAFIEWLEKYNYFCSSLVDRIVTGKPDKDIQETLEKQFGYEDRLLSMSEVYRLWAIEGNAHVKSILSFAQADEGVVIEPDINIFRELKLRLLNGTHTLSCGVAFLAGAKTVQEAMEDEQLSAFITRLLHQELAPSIPYSVPAELTKDFGNKVLDRFRNPNIKHYWIAITMQYSSKLKMRDIPCLLKHYESHNEPLPLFALGFAAYLHFTKPVKEEQGKYFGVFNGEEYHINDDMAPVFFERWKNSDAAGVAKATLADAAFWGADLSALPGFETAVLNNLEKIAADGMQAALSPAKATA